MPITARCNSRCKTCNVWTHHSQTDIDAGVLRTALADPFFSEVENVGLNGGEFTLVPNFIEIVQAVLTLPKIKSIYLISNGLFPSRLYLYLSQSHKLCKEQNVRLSFCLSVDGFGDVHDSVRGIRGGFEKTESILEEMNLHFTDYCDTFSIGCTISKHNIWAICETQNFLNKYPFEVEYHLAIPNKRIGTFDDAPYSVLTDDKSRLLAAEFFYSQYLEAGSDYKRIQYFANYYFLIHKGSGRLNTCGYLCQDVTIDENLNIYLCATASDPLGNLASNSATDIFSSNKCDEEAKRVSSLCNKCSHYTYYPLSFRGRMGYIKALMHNEFRMEYYKCHPIQWDCAGLRALLSFYYRFFYSLLRNVYHYLWR